MKEIFSLMYEYLSGEINDSIKYGRIKEKRGAVLKDKLESSRRLYEIGDMASSFELLKSVEERTPGAKIILEE